ncbi:SurA N-terminal domain-containing protein [Salinispira pacifica]|uniref:PpiC domain-containing protein n=1 Tax=Salinispira pacifica TaxID=1307761 RepID=V5WI58_9SPIO|nr:SurA N-terminal domain-containing protein [Salinispira pacifica]AHC14856.1 hypothetical protein L21SP2_1459 [Salinispira pacifica]
MPSKKHDIKNSEEKVQTSAMRHPALYVLSIIILVVVVVAFVAGPILGRSAGGAQGELVFGTYKGKDIEYAAGTYFARAYENQLQQVQQQVNEEGGDLGIQQIYTAFRNAYDSTIFRYGILDKAQKANVLVSATEVTRTLASSPRFQDEDGNFSAQLLQEALSQQPNLKEEVRKDLIFDQAQQDILMDSQLTENEIEFISQMGRERRIFDIVSYSFSEYPDSQAAVFLEENPELFRSVELSSITVGSQADAEEILERLNSSDGVFEEIAQANSSDVYAAEGGSRGVVWYYDIRRDFEDEDAADILFDLEEGQISEIFKLRNDRFAVYRADGPVREAEAGDQNALEQVKGYVLSLERGQVSDYFRTEAEAFIERSAEIGWASAVAEAGVEPVTTSPVAINYGDIPLYPTLQSASSGILTGASSRESLFTEIFSLEQNELSSAIELRDKIVVMRFVEPVTADSQQDSFMDLYIPYLAQDYLVAELQREFKDPANLEDNFDRVFQQTFLGNQN